MNNFVKYAQYYNLLYRDKDYRGEVDYVDGLIKRFNGKRSKKLINIGCGTGNHDILFAKKGYQVVGIDRAREMITIARKRTAIADHVEFFVSDISKFDLHRKFDTAISLFHVMSYLTSNELLIKSLRNVSKHLKKGGLFVVDFWYGPAVLTQKPSRRIKKISEKNINITRQAVPEINFNENTVDIDYKVTVMNKNSGLSEMIKESHKMRYFFLPELDFMLNQVGFKILKSFKWLSTKDSLSPKSWSGVVIAKKD